MLLLALALLPAPQSPATVQPRDLWSMLHADPRLSPMLDGAEANRLQVLLAEPIVHDDGSITLRRSQLGDDRQYFYPASAIKLCAAVAALLQLNAYNREHGTSLGLASKLVIEPRFAGDARIDADASNVENGTLTLQHDLRKLLLVSDNAAFNHCFELCGPDGINRAMWSAGFASVRVWHRLSESRTLAENRVTRAVRCDDVPFAARDAGVDMQNDLWHAMDVGDGYVVGDHTVQGPMSFAEKNAILLRDLQDVLVEVVRPEIDTGKRGFPELTVEQRAFLVHTLGELPRESGNPRFDPEKVPDHACKFVLRGVRRVVPAEHLRIYDKIGRAYGFSIENAYVEDRRTGRGCFLAIVLYTNPDGVLNDDRYAYEETADPFLDAVGEVMAREVLVAGAR